MIVKVTEMQPRGSVELPIERRYRCPISRAFIVAGINQMNVATNQFALLVNGKKYIPSPEMNRFINRFDSGLSVEPITINTDKLTEITETWQI